MTDPGGQGHWTGEHADPYHYFGYVYLITHTPTGKKYIGKKQFYNSKKQYGCSKRTTDRQSKEWKSRCWKESNWRVYKGSSPSLKEFMEEEGEDKFTFEILCQCRSKSILHYMECYLLWTHDVMRAKFEDGTYMYFNNSIPAIKFKIKEI